MTEALFVVIGVLVGGALAWVLASNRARAATAREISELQVRVGGGDSVLAECRRQIADVEATLSQLRIELSTSHAARVVAETRLEESLRNVEEQRKLLEYAKTELKEAFAALSREALKANAEDFVLQAGQKIEPLREALKRYEEKVQQIELARQTAYGGLTEQLKNTGAATHQLSQQTSTLVTALRAPQVKGRWGEITLQRAVEVAGLSPWCDFTPQASVDTDEGKRRPDLVVHLPGGRTVVVDSKAPTSAYLDAVEAGDENARREHLKRHAQAVRTHMQALSSKSYWSQFESAPDFVVLFLPGESFFSAALELDRTLIEESMQNRVILASPTTLIALLRTVAHSWQQRNLVDNAQQIGEAARDLFNRACVFAEHLENIGTNLRRAIEAYNAAVGSWEHKILPMGRRIAELGGTSKESEFPEVSPIEALPRSLPARVVSDD